MEFHAIAQMLLMELKQSPFTTQVWLFPASGDFKNFLPTCCHNNMSETAEAEVKKEVIEVTETVETSAPQEEVKPPLSPNDKEEPTSNLPDRPRSTSPTKPGQGTGEKRKRSRSRHRGGRGRRRLSPGPRGPRRPSPGPPPLPPPGPPPPGFRRMPDRVDSPSSPLRRGRSPGKHSHPFSLCLSL